MTAHATHHATDLLTYVPYQVKRIASTGGGRGELAGPCFICGGRDRFHIQPDWIDPQDGAVGRWFCRQCTSGRWQDAPEMVKRLFNVNYPEALRILGLDKPPLDQIARRPIAPQSPVPPSDAWQARGWRFVQEAADRLMSPDGERARAWLHQRGFSDDTIVVAMLGYNPADRWDDPAAWGLPPDAKRVWLPRGIVIPWAMGDVLWNVEIRRPLTAEQITTDTIGKCPSVKGGTKQCLLGADQLDGQRPAILVEGAFDRLAILQTVGDLAVPVAAGSTTGARQTTWVLRLAAQPRVLIATDNDEDGDTAATWWLDTLGPTATRWRPDPGYKDVADMLQSSADLRAWLLAALDHADHSEASAPPLLTPHASRLTPEASSLSPQHSDEDTCTLCGASDDIRYTPRGRVACPAHYDQLLAEDRWDDLPSASSSGSPLPLGEGQGEGLSSLSSHEFPSDAVPNTSTLRHFDTRHLGAHLSPIPPRSPNLVLNATATTGQTLPPGCVWLICPGCDANHWRTAPDGTLRCVHCAPEPEAQ